MRGDGSTSVLWLAKGLGQGGMERLLVNHARVGDRDRFDYHAAYLVDRPHSVIAELEALAVPVHRLGHGSGNDPRWVLDLVRLVRRERIDIVHAHSPMPAALARLALRLTSRRTRIVYTEHNRWDRFGTATRWANRLTFGLNDHVFAVSDDCRDTVDDRHRSAVESLVHGIDVDDVAAHSADRDDARDELGVAPESVVVGIVANFRKQKNYPLLLDVAARIGSAAGDVRFVSVGQGPLEAELVARRDELGLGDRFRFLGFRPDVHRVMSAFDVFCLSSDHEGLPVAVMEAKALGLPIVATSVGGIPQAVVDGRDGLIVPPRDPDAFLAAIERLAADPALRAELAAGSRESAGAYESHVAVARQEEVYLHG